MSTLFWKCSSIFRKYARSTHVGYLESTPKRTRTSERTQSCMLIGCMCFGDVWTVGLI